MEQCECKKHLINLIEIVEELSLTMEFALEEINSEISSEYDNKLKDRIRDMSDLHDKIKEMRKCLTK